MAKSFREKYGPWALVAGAAEGLGEAWSTSLAKRGLNLILVDIQGERMNDLANSLSARYGVQTRTLAGDLEDEETLESVSRELTSEDCRLLIYNAAYSRVKPFLESTPEELQRYVSVNCRTQLLLVHHFAGQLVHQKKTGGIVLMSSLAGLLGMQLVAPYAASKAFTWNLAEALSHELKHTGIDLMACIAGATATPAYLATNPRYGLFRPSVLSPTTVAEATLKRLGRKTRFIPGFSNRFNYFLLTRLMPRKWASNLANRTMENMYRNRKTAV